jgi:hypothetical protein
MPEWHSLPGVRSLAGMFPVRLNAILAIGALLLAPPIGADVRSVQRAATCDQGRLLAIPRRAVDAPTGSAFAKHVGNLSGPERDAAVLKELLDGNIPEFLRHLDPIQMKGAGSVRSATVCVLPNYLAIGSDRDFVFVPMGLETALRVAGSFGFELPTPKIVDAVYDAATVKLQPQPLPAGAQMRSTAYFVHHNAMIAQQRSTFAPSLDALTAGHKKDLVLSLRLWQPVGRVAIYGWHRAARAPIQPLSTVHGSRYADYSHGVRLVDRTVYVDGEPHDISAVLGEQMLSGLLTNDGPMTDLTARMASLMTRLEAPGG